MSQYNRTYIKIMIDEETKEKLAHLALKANQRQQIPPTVSSTHCPCAEADGAGRPICPNY